MHGKNTQLQSALKLAKMGFHIFPLVEGGKTPAFKDWQRMATRDEKTISAWFLSRAYNVGIFTSAFENHNAVLVLDIDNKNGKPGDSEVLRLELEGKDIPITLEQTTPNGRHLIYLVDKPVKQGANVFGRGLDVRSKGGYIVGAGSNLSNGSYRINNATIAKAPDWMIEMCGKAPERAEQEIDYSDIDQSRAAKRALDYLRTAPVSIEGNGGDQTAYQVACRLKDFGVQPDDCISLMSAHWNDKCSPPWQLDELAKKVRNAYTYGNDAPGAAAPEMQFPVVEPEANHMPAYKRHGRNGAIAANLSNVTAALSRPDQCGVRLAWDDFRAEVIVAPTGTEEWRPLTDSHYTKLRLRLEKIGFDLVSKEMVRDCVQDVAESERFDTAVLWLDSLKWDGIPRVSRFFTDYYGTPANEYSKAVSLYWWTGLAGRVLAAPCQCDMAVAITGSQGIGKTQGARAMVPSPEHFVEIDLKTDDADLARSMRGCLIGEIGELRGLHSRDAEAQKQWLSRMTERWVPKYKEFSTTYPRRLMLIATTNSDRFLADESGERRWLPLRSSGVRLEDIHRDRDQLWAEGAVLFRENGVMWADAARLATEQHSEYKLGDVWEDPVNRWLSQEVQPYDNKCLPIGNPYIRSDKPFRLAELLSGALNISPSHQTKAIEARAARVLKSLGYVNERCSIDGKQVRAWQKIRL